MKNNIFYTFFLLFFLFNLNLFSQELEVNSSKVLYDDLNKITTFEGNVNSIDEKGNRLFSEYAIYNKLDDLIETSGATKIITSNGFEVISSNVIFDNKKKLIHSTYKTQIKDKDGNKILVDMFNYSISTSIFFSKGKIVLTDVNNNNYNFSEIYIDERKNKIIGSDVKAFLNQDNIKQNPGNMPKFFANTMSLSKNTNNFTKGIFTYCKNRKDGKCPPWILQSKKIKHDLAKKTIFYDNVVLKIYDFPVFFAPKFSHPDPTVDRRSGLLAPSFKNSSTLGAGLSLPYFWDISKEKDLTFTPNLYLNENPLLLAEYKQDFKNSFLTIDAGYTQGYKKTNMTKSSGGRTHFFSNFNMSLINEKVKKSNIEINLQKVSNDTYFKVYDVDTILVKKNQSVLENTIDLTYQNKDFYFGITPGVFEDTGKKGNLRHEYLLPLTIEKNIMVSEKYGFGDLNSDIKIRNYETNKQENFLVNNFNWKSNKWLNKFGLENYFEGTVKNVNYESKNSKIYKNDGTTNELNSALGFFTKLGLYKKNIPNKSFQILNPKILLRYAPGHMRKINDGRLTYENLFNLNKTDKFDVIENGLSSSLGFEYKKYDLDKKNKIGNEIFKFSAGQVIQNKTNMDISSTTSLDQKMSDLVGTTKYNLNQKINLSYNFSVDHNYKDLNYNDLQANYNLEKVKFNLGYLQEKKHIGDQEFIKSGFDYRVNNSTELSFSTKRNLRTSSAEFYNLGYNYINDCLKAGLAYRREFYTDRDIEPKNSLMFTISIIPFAETSFPSLIK
jgi:LPS-assembly protein